MEGWICLHRKLRQNPIFNDPDLLRLWLICLTEATHKERDQIIGRQVVRLLPGQFVTGRFDLSTTFNSGLKQDRQKAPATVWRWLETLEKGQFLSINSTTKYSVITIENWRVYQDSSSSDEQQMSNKRAANEQQVSSSRATNEQQVSTNNNVNNDNNVNKEKIKRLSRQREAYAEDSSPYKMALYFLSKIREWTDKVKQPDLQRWADDCRKLLENDKRDKQLVREVIDWATSDSFWRSNILCPAKLRKQFDTLAVKMESSKKPRLIYSRGSDALHAVNGGHDQGPNTGINFGF